MAPNETMEELEAEAAELDGYFSDTPLDPQPNYPPLNESFDNAIVITNLPKVPMAKVERLTKALMKVVSRIGTLASHESFNGMHMPLSEEKGGTFGFCFVEYQSVEEANNAVNVLQGYQFDKNHALTVIPFSRALALKDIDAGEFQLPAPQPFVEKPNPTSWLEDPNQRDSFVVRQGRETTVYWSDGKNNPLVDYDGSREKEAGVAWCEYYCHWSPKGSYLATLVPSKGVILWSGSDYQKVGRFSAPGVEFVIFSPQENYLLTNNNRANDPSAIKVFNIQTGKLMRAFPLYPANFVDPKEQAAVPPPPFQWSHDDKYLARMGKDLISIFETPSMKLLDRRSLAADGIHEFQWSPKTNVLAYWVSFLQEKTKSRHMRTNGNKS